MDLTAEVVHAFLELRQDVKENKELISKCLEICEQFSIKPRQLVFKWEAHMGDAIEEAPKLEHFEILRSEIARKTNCKQEKSSIQRGIKEGVKFDINSIQSLGQMLSTNLTSSKVLGNLKVKSDPSFLASSVTTTVASKRKMLDSQGSVAPVGSKLKVLPSTETDKIPHANTSVVDLQEATRFANREQKFKRLNVLNEALPSVVRDNPKSRCELEILRSVPNFRYMYERIENKCFNLLDRLKTITDGIIEVNRLREKATSSGQTFSLSPVNMASQERIWCCGRICPEGEVGSLNAYSVLLEGANGRRVKLDTSALSDFALFPGQIVVVEGNNTTGNCIVANSIHCDASLSLPSTAEEQLETFNESPEFLNGAPLSIVVAAGPFTTSMDLSYKPLDDLLEYAREHRPDVLLLCGPFADWSHRLLDPSSTSLPEGFNPPDTLSLVQRIMRDHIAIPLKNLGIKCLLVPSVSDLHSTCVFPQPAFDPDIVFGGSDGLLKSTDALPMLLSNPCTFRINEVVVSISTTDILLHLSGNEASRISSDRLSRLAAHIVEQRSVYPMFPPAEGSQISMANSSSLDISITPDILVLPSQLNPFAKRTGDVLCINPGRLTKGSSAGTFAHITIHPIVRHLNQRGSRISASNFKLEDKTKVGFDVEMREGRDAGEEERAPEAKEVPSLPGDNSVSALPNGNSLAETDYDVHLSRIADVKSPVEHHSLEEMPKPSSDVSSAAENMELAPARENLESEGEASIEMQSLKDGNPQAILHRILARTKAEIIRI